MTDWSNIASCSGTWLGAGCCPRSCPLPVPHGAQAAKLEQGCVPAKGIARVEQHLQASPVPVQHCYQVKSLPALLTGKHYNLKDLELNQLNYGCRQYS